MIISLAIWTHRHGVTVLPYSAEGIEDPAEETNEFLLSLTASNPELEREDEFLDFEDIDIEKDVVHLGEPIVIQKDIGLIQADQQLTGYVAGWRGDSIEELVSSMGLSAIEWDKLKPEFEWIPENIMASIDNYFDAPAGEVQE